MSSDDTQIRPSSAAVRQAWTGVDQSTVTTGDRCPRRFNTGLSDVSAVSTCQMTTLIITQSLIKTTVIHQHASHVRREVELCKVY